MCWSSANPETSYGCTHVNRHVVRGILKLDETFDLIRDRKEGQLLPDRESTPCCVACSLSTMRGAAVSGSVYIKIRTNHDARLSMEVSLRLETIDAGKLELVNFGRINAWMNASSDVFVVIDGGASADIAADGM